VDRKRKVVYYAAMTLDGFIADSGHGIDWLIGYDGSYEGPGATPQKGTYDEFFEGIGSLVMGSATYDFLLGHTAAGNAWPYLGTPTWVLSSRELPAIEGEGVDLRFARGDVAELAPEMIEGAGDKQLWVVGGGNVATQFVDAGLLDTVIVTVVPVVLGEGKPLFDERVPGEPMKLTGTRAFDSGMVELSYALRS
jgi:dihydrofolate reductase